MLPNYKMKTGAIILIIAIIAIVGLLIYLSSRNNQLSNGLSQNAPQLPLTDQFVCGIFIPGPSLLGQDYTELAYSIHYGIESYYEVAEAPQQVRIHKVIKIFNSDQELVNFIKEFEQEFSQYRRLIVSGVSTDQLILGAKTIQDLRTETLTVSMGSTSPAIESLPNSSSVLYSDQDVAMVILAQGKLKQVKNVWIVHSNSNTYSLTYALGIDEMSTKFNFVDVRSIAYGPNELNRIVQVLANVPESTLIVFVPNVANELVELSHMLKFTKSDTNPFPDNVSFICGEICSNLGDWFSPGLDVCVAIPYASDYTDATRRLYEYLHANYPTPGYFYSNLCPFVYDIGYKIAMLAESQEANIRNGFMQLHPEIPAALSNNGINIQTGRPAFSNYHFCYTANPSFIQESPEEIRKEYLGAVQTLPDGVDVPFRTGKYAWTGTLGYSYLTNSYETHTVGGQVVFRKMAFAINDKEGKLLGYNEDVRSLMEINGQIYVPDYVNPHMIEVEVSYHA